VLEPVALVSNLLVVDLKGQRDGTKI